MTTTAALTIAVLAALGAACSFGVGVALQHRQVQRERNGVVVCCGSSHSWPGVAYG